MNSTKKTMLCVAMAVAAATGANAQNRSGYFLDNYSYNYQMNPAMGREGHGEFGFPGLGSLNLGVNSNVGLNTFLHQLPNGQMATFLHPDVSTDDAMSRFKNRMRLGVDVRENIIHVGFKGLGGYNHISINAVAGAQVRLPKSIFSFLKEGIENKTYDIGRIDAQADAYAEIALNHSHDMGKILPGLRVGGSFKFLVGVGNVDINMDRADLELGTDAWRATTNGVAKVSLKGFDWKLNDDGQVDDVDMDNISGPNGYGMAIDLGATYEWKDFTFALAFNDLGFINWQHTVKAGTNGAHTFDSNNYILDPADIDASWDQMKDDLTDLYDLRPEGDAGNRVRALAATMNLSVEYALPMYKNLTFGFLNTTRMAHRFAWTDFRLSANLTPVKWIGLNVNYGVGTFGDHFGWMLNLAPKGFNIYFGMEHTLGKLAKQYVPKNLNAQLSFGLNFPF